MTIRADRARAAAVRRHAAKLLELMAPEPPHLIAEHRAVILRGDYQGPGRNRRTPHLRCPACSQLLPGSTE